MVPLKAHFDVSDVLYCTVTYLKMGDETKWKPGKPNCSLKSIFVRDGKTNYSELNF
jgi:hypothetical protein